MFCASPSLSEVTTFQAARPFVIRSSVANSARHVERLVIARRIGRAETEPLGRHAHHREHGDGVELHAADAVGDGVGVIAAVHVRHRQPVVEKAEVKLALLQHAADMPVKIRRPAVGARSGMAPGTGEVAAVLRLQEADQDHLAHVRQVSRAQCSTERSEVLRCRPGIVTHAELDDPERSATSRECAGSSLAVDRHPLEVLGRHRRDEAAGGGFGEPVAVELPRRAYRRRRGIRRCRRASPSR